MDLFSPPHSPLPNGVAPGFKFSQFSSSSSPKPPQSPIRVQSPPMGPIEEEDEENEEEEDEEEDEEDNEDEDELRSVEKENLREEEGRRKIPGGKPANLKLPTQNSQINDVQQQKEMEKVKEKEEHEKLKLVEEQAFRLFHLCDQEGKGFIIRADLDRLQALFPPDQFIKLERVFVLADRYRVNLAYEKDFLAVIKPYLLGCQKKELNQQKEEHSQSANNIFTISRVGMFENGGGSGFHGEFRNISLDTDERKNSSSAEEWSPTRKLTIAIDSGPNVDHGAGLASVGRDDVPMGYLGTGPGGISPSSQLSEYWHNSTTTNTGGRRTGSHSPSTHSGISLHDDLLNSSGGTQIAHHHLLAAAINDNRSNGFSAHVSLREMQSPGSTCSEPLPLRDADFTQQYLTRRITCGNAPAICPERIFKVVFVGDSAVGKTCFLHRFCHNRFKPLFSATIGVDFTVKTLPVRDRLVALQLWDTAGQERFRSITKQYFRKADGVVLMYDVTSETSFINVRNWIESVRVGVDDGCVLCLVGNKVDLYPNEHCRTITYQHGKDLAQEFDMLFFETSAFTGQGIGECMQALALRLQQREDEHMDELIKLESMMTNGKRSWCCI